MTLKTNLTLASLSSLMLIMGSAPAQAISGFTGVYAPNNFTFSSDPAGAGDEGADLDTTNAAAGEVILYGPDNTFNGSGTTPAYSEWTIAIDTLRAGTVSFDWSFESFTGDGDDIFTYFVNSNTLLTVSGNGGTQSSVSPANVTLADGDTFGFRVSTNSNQGGEGTLTINNFDFVATPVPFETDALPIVLSAGFMGGGIWIKRRLKRVKDLN